MVESYVLPFKISLLWGEKPDPSLYHICCGRGGTSWLHQLTKTSGREKHHGVREGGDEWGARGGSDRASSRRDTYCRWQRLGGQTGRSVVMKGKRSALFSPPWPNQALLLLPDTDSTSPFCVPSFIYHCLFVCSCLRFCLRTPQLLFLPLFFPPLFFFYTPATPHYPVLFSLLIFLSPSLPRTKHACFWLSVCACNWARVCVCVCLRPRPSHGRLHRL